MTTVFDHQTHIKALQNRIRADSESLLRLTRKKEAQLDGSVSVTIRVLGPVERKDEDV
jgi:hypothetical protein